MLVHKFGSYRKGIVGCSIIGGVKWLAIAVAALLLSSCAKNIDNQEAVQKAVDKYFAGRTDLRSMTARVANVIFRGNEADATVMVSANGTQSVPIPYVLEKQSDGWVVKGPSKGAMAGHAAQGGGQMPAGHPGMATGAPDTSGQPLPPGHPGMSGGMGKAPGSEPDGSQKLNLPPDHPPMGSAK